MGVYNYLSNLWVSLFLYSEATTTDFFEWVDRCRFPADCCRSWRLYKRTKAAVSLQAPPPPRGWVFPSSKKTKTWEMDQSRAGPDRQTNQWVDLSMSEPRVHPDRRTVRLSSTLRMKQNLFKFMISEFKHTAMTFLLVMKHFQFIQICLWPTSANKTINEQISPQLFFVPVTGCDKL